MGRERRILCSEEGQKLPYPSRETNRASPVLDPVPELRHHKFPQFPHLSDVLPRSHDAIRAQEAY
jgi:hypothetical protein